VYFDSKTTTSSGIKKSKTLSVLFTPEKQQKSVQIAERQACEILNEFSGK